MINPNCRNQFPITDKYCYLDHAGVGPVSLRVRDNILNFLNDSCELAGFGYDKWMEQVDAVRKTCAKLIAASEDEIAFVKSTSHGISLVASGLEWKKGDNILIYKKEFPSNIYPWLNLEKKGVETKFISGTNGEINLSEIENLSDSNTRLISISSVQYTNGFRSDLKAIGEFCNNNGIYFMVDAIQSLGVIPMNVKEYKIDFLSADGHKWIMAPEGTGIFYCSKKNTDDLQPSLLGWKSIVNDTDYGTIDFNLKKNALKFEEGSLNVMGIIALGEAVEYLLETGISDINKRVHLLGDYIIKKISEREFTLNTPSEKNKRAGIISFIGDFNPMLLRDKLEELGVMVNFRGGGIRVSPHFYNNESDIDRLFAEIDKLI
ncbi:MAG: aminotransferase class V-fold PLP-dependent enzyme [Candidatus Dadabacteria bacterium]|nr:aminotransferase class V-fold PLP-dependent enzyme [Candidatus Dadabacteria bacterium]NIQ16679.1 aminotransferase class V-fold PLP-dependent enzyme [Candidatus Dadabacteria bacterium]